ncbi:PREDICTED: glutathione S-transferase P 1-like, partial [Nanorana parkeri]|uniref:glutathione S-transferase P 1-like n=1 Tax=Nanorana parkeri TaxID=125878 RepID=UPI000854ECCB
VFGQLPRFQDGDFVLYQSNAILRYLGRKFVLKQACSLPAQDREQTGKEKYLKDLPNQLSPFEKILSNNANGTKFVVGDKISYADYNLLDILHCHLDLEPKCLASFPLLSAYIQRCATRPKLNTYLQSEKRNKRPITPKHK